MSSSVVLETFSWRYRVRIGDFLPYRCGKFGLRRASTHVTLDSLKSFKWLKSQWRCLVVGARTRAGSRCGPVPPAERCPTRPFTPLAISYSGNQSSFFFRLNYFSPLSRSDRRTLESYIFWGFLFAFSIFISVSKAAPFPFSPVSSPPTPWLSRLVCRDAAFLQTALFSKENLVDV